MADHLKETANVHTSHLKFVGVVDAVDTYGDVWTQRVYESNVLDGEAWIDWHLTGIPLPEGAGEGHYVSVHRTKAGHWYAVNLSKRMGPITESQIRRAEARALRWGRKLGLDWATNNGSYSQEEK